MNLHSHPRFFLWCGFVCSLGSIGWAQVLSADGDRVPDYWEERYNLDTTTNDGLADSDGDGVSNQAEFLADTNPTNPLSFLQLDVEWNPTNDQSIEAVELLKIPEIALDIAAGPGGAILGMHFGGNQIFVAQPREPPAAGMKAVDIFPWRAPASGTFSFVIGGRGFSTPADTSVAIGGATATVSTVSSTRIRGLLPAAGGVTTNLVDVVVQSGGRTSVLTRAFRYLPPL